VLFDFDGTLWDSEAAVFEVFRELYRHHGHDLPVETWAAAIGTVGGFDPYATLQHLVAGALDLAAVEAQTEDRIAAAAAGVPLRPGIEAFLDDVDRAGLPRAIVSSDTTEWVMTHLRRLRRVEGWAAIVCADGARERAKPSPALYVEALQLVGVSEADAIAFEDSPNGIRAAKAAGIACVCVPNALTAELDLSGADARFQTFEGLHLREVVRGLCDRRRVPSDDAAP
jgi:HAD superfamily hydrolase (TIGR01509 family)